MSVSQILGHLSVFDHRSQDWTIFYGRLVQFLKLNCGIKDEQKSALLLTHLADDTYRLASNLVHPRKIDEVTYSELIAVLDAQFKPKRCIFADRAKFYEARRAAGENIEEWAARVRGLAVHCAFDSLEKLIMDKFVLGLNAGPEKDKLFEQDATTLTFGKAVEIAQQMACARAVREQQVQVQVKEEPMYRVGAERSGQRAAPGASGGGVAPAGQARCTVCGLKSHSAIQCRFKKYKCRACHEVGHLSKVCRNKGSAGLHNIETVTDSSATTAEGSHDCEECEMYNLRSVNYAPIVITVKLNDIELQMEIDSGSGTSVISQRLYLTHFSNMKIKEGNLKMCLYNGHKISPLGYFTTHITYLNTTKPIKIYVVENGGPPLLGRDFMTDFGFYLMTDNNSIISHNRGLSEVQLLLNEFSNLFHDGLGKFNRFEVDLQLKEGAQARYFKPRTIPFALKDKVEDEIDRLVSLGILIPVNHSKYGTPIVPVLKENGKVKIAGDFSVTLNKDLKVDKYPLPRIEEVFAKIGGGEHYSKIDLSNAYNQFVLSESSQELTTISTHKGLFKYTRLVYGLANAPAIFQRAMESLLVGIDGVSCWLDDVCVTGPSKEIHLMRLREVLSRLNNAGLKLQKEKCVFFKNSVTYLGYVIDKTGLKTCPSKIEAIVKAPTPTNTTEVKRFIGVVNYYRNFVPNTSSILAPLNDLLKKGAKFEWRESQQHAFDKMKCELSSERVLAHFDPRAQLILSVDAGPNGLGAVLAQRSLDGVERPLSFASRSLSVSEKNYSQIQKEATAIVFGVKRFHMYLYGREEPFILKTDHRPLLSIFGNKVGISVMAASRLQRYAILLSAYNYTVQYIKGENNVVADFFSRSPVNNNDKEEDDDLSFLKFLNVSSAVVTNSDIKSATSKDSVLQTVIKYMQNGWPRKIICQSILPYFNCKADLEVDDGCLFRGLRIVVPEVYKRRMLEELHSSHLGIVKTKCNARSRMWWPGIDGDIERWVGSCSECAAVRAAPPRAPPAPWPRPAGPWQRLHIDYMSIGQRDFLVVVDAYSKWLECILMDHGTSTRALIVKLKSLFTVFGLPMAIVSDNDPKICSFEFKTFCQSNGIRYVNSPIYHPASNGQAENSVKNCKKMISCIIKNNYNVDEITDKLSEFIFTYRTTAHCSTGSSPAKLMFGRELRNRLDMVLPNKNMSENTEESCVLNKSRCFKIGDYVWTKMFVARKEKWVLGTIRKCIGNRMFEVFVNDHNDNCIRHLDQLIKYSGDYESFVNGSASADSAPPAPAPPPSPESAARTEHGDEWHEARGDDSEDSSPATNVDPVPLPCHPSGHNLRPRNKPINYKL